jgi:hypothetical protein
MMSNSSSIHDTRKQTALLIELLTKLFLICHFGRSRAYHSLESDL